MLKNISKELLAFLIIYIIAFIYLIVQDPIYTPDTSSYLGGSIWRSPGYPSFSIIIKFLFKGYYNLVIVGFQLVLGFIAIHCFLTSLFKTIKLHVILKFLLLGLLLFPFFSPLYVANNICSEGLSYPFYLLLLAFAINLLYHDNSKTFWLLVTTSILLNLTRGQFTISILIIAFLYVLKHRKSMYERFHIFRILVLISILFISSFLDKSYHKIASDQFVSTPFTFINASAAALYVSDDDDIDAIDNKDHKAIFKDCYAFISENGWLLSSDKRESSKADYLHFHENLGRICNYTLHRRGTAYYIDKGYTEIEARIEIERTAKTIYPILVKRNFKKYITLLGSNLVYGFKSFLLLLLTIIIFLFSLFKLFKAYTKHYSLIFLCSSLILSNALIVAFASHAIMRYLFYNYSLILLLVVLLYKILRREFKS